MLAWYRGDFDNARDQARGARPHSQRGGRTRARRRVVHAQRAHGIDLHPSGVGPIRPGRSGRRRGGARQDGTTLRRTGLPPRRVQPGLRAADRGPDPHRSRPVGPRRADVAADLASARRAARLRLVGAGRRRTSSATRERAVIDWPKTPSTPPHCRPHIATITAFVDAWRAFGVSRLITFYDALLARLLIAAGRRSTRPATAIEIALELADETGMHFYDAELLAIRARTPRRRRRHVTPISARRSIWPASRARRSSNCALRSDDFELRGDGTAGARRRDQPLPRRQHAGPSSTARGPCSGEAPRRQGRHPRRRHGGVERRLAAQRARLA